jgi:hypothetical protein
LKLGSWRGRPVTEHNKKGVDGAANNDLHSRYLERAGSNSLGTKKLIALSPHLHVSRP